MKTSTPLKKQIALIGFASDTGVRRNFGRPGAVEGPQAIKRALAKLPAHVPPSWHFYDAGTVVCSDDNLESAQASLAHLIALLLEAECFPIVLGGGHELAWGHYQGVVAAYPHERLGIVNCDAHFDLRDPLPNQQTTSGSSFYQIAEECRARNRPFHYLALGIQKLQNISPFFHRAEQFEAQVIDVEKARQTSMALETLRAFIGNAERLFVSLCMDVFAAAFAPGVSAPQPFGLTPSELLPLLLALTREKKCITFHLAEVAPPLDRDGQTVALAAELLSAVMHSRVAE